MTQATAPTRLQATTTPKEAEMTSRGGSKFCVLSSPSEAVAGGANRGWPANLAAAAPSGT